MLTVIDPRSGDGGLWHMRRLSAATRPPPTCRSDLSEAAQASALIKAERFNIRSRHPPDWEVENALGSSSAFWSGR